MNRWRSMYRHMRVTLMECGPPFLALASFNIIGPLPPQPPLHHFPDLLLCVVFSILDTILDSRHCPPYKVDHKTMRGGKLTIASGRRLLALSLAETLFLLTATILVKYQ